MTNQEQLEFDRQYRNYVMTRHQRTRTSQRTSHRRAILVSLAIVTVLVAVFLSLRIPKNHQAILH